MVDICIHIVPIYLEKNRFFICICGYLFGLGPHLLYLYPGLAAERHIRGYNYSYLLKSVSGDTEQNSNLYLYSLSVCNPRHPAAQLKQPWQAKVLGMPQSAPGPGAGLFAQGRACGAALILVSPPSLC